MLESNHTLDSSDRVFHKRQSRFRKRGNPRRRREYFARHFAAGGLTRFHAGVHGSPQLRLRHGGGAPSRSAAGWTRGSRVWLVLRPLVGRVRPVEALGQIGMDVGVAGGELNFQRYQLIAALAAFGGKSLGLEPQRPPAAEPLRNRPSPHDP